MACCETLGKPCLHVPLCFTSLASLLLRVRTCGFVRHHPQRGAGIGYYHTVQCKAGWRILPCITSSITLEGPLCCHALLSLIICTGASALFSVSFWFCYNTAINQIKSICFSYYKYWLTFPLQRKLTPLYLGFDLGLFVEGKWMHTSLENVSVTSLNEVLHTQRVWWIVTVEILGSVRIFCDIEQSF